MTAATKPTAFRDLRGVVRIAKAASAGVTGNGPRIKSAEDAIGTVSELVATAGGILFALDNDGFVCAAQHNRLRAALAPFEVTP